MEIIDSIKGVYPLSRVSVKLSPVMRYGDMYDANPQETYSSILQQLDKKLIGAVEITS